MEQIQSEKEKNFGLGSRRKRVSGVGLAGSDIHMFDQYITAIAHSSSWARMISIPFG